MEIPGRQAMYSKLELKMERQENITGFFDY